MEAIDLHIGSLVFDHADYDPELLDRDGRLIITVPETVEASADELAPVLVTPSP
ncbi:MAG: hypothetical protein H0T15_00835 [Thermoleophilaceae bacterium]|nr:hypothetical protein [Thermoleophilaceae bacterium]